MEKKRYLIIICLFLFGYISVKANVIEIDSFIHKDAIISKGIINSIKQDGRYYLEIPSKIINRDMLVTITITKGAMRKQRKDDMRFGYGGDSMFSKLIRWAKENDKIEILLPSSNYTDPSNINVEYIKSIPVPVYKSFPIVAHSSNSDVIDITEMLMSDDELFSLKGGASELKIGAPISMYTKIERICSFPENINFLSLRSYTLAEPAKDEQANSQWEVSSSWILLPEKPMTPRFSDERVGYFPTAILGLSKNKTVLENSACAVRWRLEPKDDYLEQYKRGELVEPKKPITFYISRSVPEYLRPYFMKAVTNWNEAFECAGFKNAIRAEMVPSDSTFDEGDARYPLISYKSSPIPNAYGPNVADPRSGEIITSHIAVYHSVLDLLQRWYFVMCSPVDKRATTYPLSKDIMGKLAETVLTHEVGHTLGLRHNFVGSTLFPVDSLRSGKFIHENGLGASIMDYQRFDYVLQPGDKVDYNDILPRIGLYDKFAIEWGYRYYDGMNTDEVAKIQKAWVTKKRATERSCFFLSETELGDPRVQSEDCGDDDIKANTYGMKNLEYIMNHLEEWTQTADDDYYPLRRRYLSVQNQYWYYIGHILKYINGHYSDRPERDENMNVKVTVPRELQLRALNFLKEYLFIEPVWLWRPELMDKTGVDWSYALETASNKLAILFLSFTASAATNKNDDLIQNTELFDFIYDNLYGIYPKDKPLSVYVRKLQRSFLVTLTINAENPSTFGIGVGLKLKQMLERIKANAESASTVCKDNVTKDHYQAITNFITMWQTGDNKSLLKK